jgi:dihydroorotase
MIVLQGGRVIDPAVGRDEVADVLVDERGQVHRVGLNAGAHVQGERVRRVDVTGLWVVPGLIDLHVHFREPGHEYKESIETGLRAAAAGGFTQVCAMPNTDPVNDCSSVTSMMLGKAAALQGSRLHPVGAITKQLRGEELSNMGELRESGARMVSDDGRCVTNAGLMRRALEYARTFDLLVSQHAEEHSMTVGAQMHEGAVATRLGLRGWPREAEDVIVARDLILTEMTGARYHVAHISSLGSVRLLREAKSRGLRVSAEVTPHHLALTDEAVIGYNTACKVNPPLRSEEHREALVEALREGVIDCVATDHAPHSTLEKDCEFSAAACGMTGLEVAVPMMLQWVRQGVVDARRLVELMSTNPARIAGLAGGRLREGDPADITVIDPHQRWQVGAEPMQSKSRNTPVWGAEVQGRVTMTWVQGRQVYDRSSAS